MDRNLSFSHIQKLQQHQKQLQQSQISLGGIAELKNNQQVYDLNTDRKNAPFNKSVECNKQMKLTNISNNKLDSDSKKEKKFQRESLALQRKNPKHRHSKPMSNQLGKSSEGLNKSVILPLKKKDSVVKTTPVKYKENKTGSPDVFQTSFTTTYTPKSAKLQKGRLDKTPREVKENHLRTKTEVLNITSDEIDLRLKNSSFSNFFERQLKLSHDGTQNFQPRGIPSQLKKNLSANKENFFSGHNITGSDDESEFDLKLAPLYSLQTERIPNNKSVDISALTERTKMTSSLKLKGDENDCSDKLRQQAKRKRKINRQYLLRMKNKRLRNKMKRDIRKERGLKRKLEKENESLKNEKALTLKELKSSKKDRINMEIILKMQHHILQKFNPKMLQICPQFVSDSKSTFIIQENDFEVFRDRVLGKGGFAEVYQGKFKGKTVAVKRMEIPHEYAKMLFNEISTMIACDNHAHIVNLLAVAFGDISETSMQVYIIMEILEKDLKKLIHKEKVKLSLSEKYRILVDVLKGLDHLHEMNYVHCDIKLQNILIDKTYNAKISDFGLAKTLRSGNTKNTMTYGFSERTSSFEYLVEEKVSTKADIWSFGILMYELLSEKVAWESLSGPQAVAKISVKTPFYSCNEKIGTKADSIIEKCLNYDYTKRPNAKELIAEIKSLPFKT